MKLYLYTPDTSKETQRSASIILDTISALSDKGRPYLPPDATVWANAAHHSCGMWVLGETSTHIRLHDTITAGAARINRQCVRFGESTEKSHTDPQAIFRITDIPTATYDSPSSTIIVRHAQPDKRVAFIAGSAKGNVTNGTCHFDPFTVVDLHHYTAPEHASTNPLVAAHAMVNGVELMCQGLSEDRAQFVRDNIESFVAPTEKWAMAMDRIFLGRDQLAEKIVSETYDSAIKHGMPAHVQQALANLEHND